MNRPKYHGRIEVLCPLVIVDDIDGLTPRLSICATIIALT